MGLLDLIAAYAVAQGSHTGGHFDQAAKQGIPIKLEGIVEKWNQPDVRKNTDIDGAGFQLQDSVANSVDNKNINLANALIKIGYLLDTPAMLDKNLAGYGDIRNMERESGNPHVDKMILATALSDLMKYNNPEQKWSIGFSTFGTGQPGIVYNRRW